jgi:hypothetical protein
MRAQRLSANSRREQVQQTKQATRSLSLAREQQHRPLGETKTLMRAAASLRLFAARVIVLPT